MTTLKPGAISNAPLSMEEQQRLQEQLLRCPVVGASALASPDAGRKLLKQDGEISFAETVKMIEGVTGRGGRFDFMPEAAALTALVPGRGLDGLGHRITHFRSQFFGHQPANGGIAHYGIDSNARSGPGNSFNQQAFDELYGPLVQTAKDGERWVPMNSVSLTRLEAAILKKAGKDDVAGARTKAMIFGVAEHAGLASFLARSYDKGDGSTGLGIKLDVLQRFWEKGEVPEYVKQSDHNRLLRAIRLSLVPTAVMGAAGAAVDVGRFFKAVYSGTSQGIASIVEALAHPSKLFTSSVRTDAQKSVKNAVCPANKGVPNTLSAADEKILEQVHDPKFLNAVQEISRTVGPLAVGTLVALATAWAAGVPLPTASELQNMASTWASGRLY